MKVISHFEALFLFKRVLTFKKDSLALMLFSISDHSKLMRLRVPNQIFDELDFKLSKIDRRLLYETIPTAIAISI